jgi:uncharacterized protein (TIGR02646 family)
MRFIHRPDLDEATHCDLASKQAAAVQKRHEGKLDCSSEWKRERQSRTLRAVLATLRQMMGERQRCMYCLDSHGTDIEHFRPKMRYPESMFVWPNLLLCCAECGRAKGDRFPTSPNGPLLIDPTQADPWLDLDFDPLTGNIVARFNPQSNDYSERGIATVKLLNLDRRESLAAGHRKTFRILARLVQRFIEQPDADGGNLVESLQEADEHGLLHWCVTGLGSNQPPFRELRESHPLVWSLLLDSTRTDPHI